MQLPVLVISRETQRAIRVVLSDWPFRCVWIPKSCIRSAFELGDRGVILEVVGCVAAEIEQDGWRRMMQNERFREEAKVYSAASQERQA